MTFPLMTMEVVLTVALKDMVPVLLIVPASVVVLPLLPTKAPELVKEVSEAVSLLTIIPVPAVASVPPVMEAPAVS